MSSPLVKLPYELLALIVRDLDLEDTRALSMACRRLQFLFYESSIAKAILESKAPNTLEAGCARTNRRFAAELRRLVKRRDAISSVSPYLVATIAYAETWIYENGVLCHIKDRQLRILDLHHSGTTEIKVDIRKLLDEAIKESHGLTKYKFQLLYFAHGVVSCLYTHRKHVQSSWLVVFDVRNGKIITTYRLSSTLKIFVRNTDKFLCYGVFLPTGREGIRRWSLGGYDLVLDTWMKQKLDLPENIGSDIGSTIALDIHDDFLYGVSNSKPLEAEEDDWLSYYTCFRIQLGCKGFQTVELAPERHMFRRWHSREGAIDDRWTFLRISRDQETSQLRVIESRKEWPGHRSSAKRTYYSTNIVFDDGPSANDAYLDCVLGLTPTKSASDLPEPPREPKMVHPGDDASEAIMFTRTKSPVLCYHHACQAFVDLVDDPPELDPGARRIRIRGGARRRRAPRELEERGRAGAAETETEESHYTLSKETEPKMPDFPNTFDEIAKIYENRDVLLWPPEQSLSRPDPALEELHKIMNPPGCLGTIRGAWDERSMVYSIEETGGLHALVFVSWDPALYLEGAKRYPGAPNIGGSSGAIPGSPSPPAMLSHDIKGKSKDQDSGSWHPATEPETTCCEDESTAFSVPGSSAGLPTWQKCVPAMYRTMPTGFHFAL